MLEEVLEKRIGFWISRAGRSRSADFCTGKRRPNALYRVVIEIPILLRRGVPVINVRLIPDFEIPMQHLILAISLDQVGGDGPRKLSPPRIVLRRIVALTGDRRLRKVNLVRLMPVRKVRSQIPRHKSKLYHGPDPGRLIRVEEAVEDLEAVDRFAVGVF